MKKLILILFLTGLACAQVTPHLGLTKPARGTKNWDVPLNTDFNILDNIFALTTCGDTSHAVGWDAAAKVLTCQAIAGGGSSVWGTVSGTLSSQTDLQNALNLKAPLLSPSFTTPALGTPSSGILTNATGLPLTTGVTGLLPVANGGTGTATPGIVAGTSITVSGTWPNQTVNATGGGGSGDALVASPLSQFAATTSLQLKNTISDETGSGLAVFATSPVFTTPNIGAATGSISGNAGTATALAANGANCSAGQAPLGVDASGAAEGCFTPSGSGDALTTQPLSQFAATTSAQLLGILSNETGSGLAVFNTSPTFVTPVLGTPTSVTLTNATGLPEAGVTSLVSDLALKSPLASPTFTGVPVVPTAAPGTNTTQAASTAFVLANPGAGANLTGPITSTGAATVVAPAGVVTQKPDTTTAVQYAALKCAAGVACSDANDGLSWGTAKLTIMAAYDALPAAGGEIRFADGVTANSVAGAGIWIMGGNDPSFSSPPSGWRQIKTGNVSFVGVEQAGYTGLEHLGKSNIVAGSTADRNHPGIWLSATNITLHFSNLYVKYPGRGIVIGECSNHLRDQTCNSAGITFDNVAAATTGNLSQVAGTGPAWDITGGSFWVFLNNCGANGTDQYNDPLGDLAPAILVDGRTNFGVGFVYIDKSNTSAGAIKFYEGANGGGLYVSDTTSENLHSPATVWLKTFSATSDIASFTNITTADPETGGILTAVLTPANGGAGYAISDTGLITTGFGTAKYIVTGVTSGAVTTFTFTTGGGYSVASSVPTTVTTGGGNAAFQVNITSVQGAQFDVLNSDTSAVGANNIVASNATTGGPVNQLGGNSLSSLLSINPLAQQQVGMFSGRQLGQDDNARRGFPPVAVRVANLATTPTSGTGLTTGVAAPDGTTGAVTLASGSIGETAFYDAAYTAVVGDWWVGGVWVKGTGFYQSLKAAKFELVGASGLFTGRNVASGNVSYCQPPWAGNGEWQWTWCVAKVTATDSTSRELKFIGQVDSTSTTSYYGPVFFKIANGTVPDNEVWEIANSLRSYSSTCTAGQLCTMAGALASSSGTVTSFSAGDLSPLFTTSEATITTTPALTFSLSTAAAHTFFGNNTGSTAAPGFQAIAEGDVTSLTSDLALKAPLASPTFTGTVTLPSGQALIAPALGTPASGVLTNATGLPLSTGVTGTLAAAQEPAHTGDMTNSAGSLTTVVGKINGIAITGTPSTGQVPTATGTTAATWQTPSGGGTPSYPVTVAGTVTSGGIPYFSATTTETSSALLTSNSPVLGGGAGAAPKTATFLTTNGTSELDIGVAGASGVLGLKGTTSGTATITAPAVAGTVINPFVFSNSLGAPNGTASNPSITFASDSITGFYSASGTLIGVAGNVRYTTTGFPAEYPASSNLLWGSDDSFSGFDASFSRAAAGVLQVGKTTTRNSTGGFRASYYAAGGTKFTASGCTNGTTVGGASAGSLLTGVSGACTLTVTMGDSDTAANGWSCWASDQTTAAGNPIYQNGGSTTTATLALPAGNVSGDKISFGCMAY